MTMDPKKDAASNFQQTVLALQLGLAEYRGYRKDASSPATVERSVVVTLKTSWRFKVCAARNTETSDSAESYAN